MLGIPYPFGKDPRPVGIFSPEIPGTKMRFMINVQGEYKPDDPPSPDDDPNGGPPVSSFGQIDREPTDYVPYVPFELKLVA